MEARNGEVTFLLNKWRQGDMEALNELVPIIYNDLRGIARKYLRDQKKPRTLTSLDLVQAGLMKHLTANFPKEFAYRGEYYSAFKIAIGWIAIEYERKRGSKRMLEDLYGNEFITFLTDENFEETIVEKLENKRNFKLLQKSLKKIKMKDKEGCDAFVERYFNGEKYDDISAKFGIPKSTIQKRVKRVKEYAIRYIGAHTE
jgi:RNA polymerase sigma factor (sigma-70 family)